MGELNKQKLMRTQTGQVLPKPRVRRGKRRSGGSFPWPEEERRNLDRTTWVGSIQALFRPGR